MREAPNAHRWTSSVHVKSNWKILLQRAKSFQEQTVAIRLAIKQGVPCCEIEEYIDYLFGPNTLDSDTPD